MVVKYLNNMQQELCTTLLNGMEVEKLPMNLHIGATSVSYSYGYALHECMVHVCSSTDTMMV